MITPALGMDVNNSRLSNSSLKRLLKLSLYGFSPGLPG
jgi:hypothetical protein